MSRSIEDILLNCEDVKASKMIVTIHNGPYGLFSSIKHEYRAMIVAQGSSACTSFHGLVLSRGDKLLNPYLSCRSLRYTTRKSLRQSPQVRLSSTGVHYCIYFQGSKPFFLAHGWHQLHLIRFQSNIPRTNGWIYKGMGHFILPRYDGGKESGCLHAVVWKVLEAVRSILRSQKEIAHIQI